MGPEGPVNRQQIEDKYDRRLKDILREMIVERHFTLSDIVSELGMTEPSVRHWLKHYELYGLLYEVCPCCGRVKRHARKRSS